MVGKATKLVFLIKALSYTVMLNLRTIGVENLHPPPPLEKAKLVFNFEAHTLVSPAND